MSSVSANVKIINRLGLHARPAMCFVDLAMQYPCEVQVKRGDQVVDGKSIMMMMLLAATQGTELVIVCEGEQAEEALAALKKLVDTGFDEE
ncbi:MAG: HPr family phosphocarrier protein [Phycisphaerales bacterium]|jgi:phosphocarrier protein HPr|nr:HPr family phosphocarrier protein [Phycisphaerales bacterium]